MKIYLLTTFLFLKIFTLSYSQNTLTIAECERKIKNINEVTKTAKSKVVRIKSWKNNREMLTISLSVNNNMPLRLKYPLFEDSGNNVGEGYIYFDYNGQVFAQSMNISNLTIVDVLLGKHQLLTYTETSGKSVKKNTHDDNVQKYREQNLIYITDFYMQQFPMIRYYRNNPSQHSPPVLHSLINEIKVYDKPSFDGRIISKVKKNEYVNYIEIDSIRVLKDGESWSFIKILKEDKKVGWVWGSPNHISNE